MGRALVLVVLFVVAEAWAEPGFFSRREPRDDDANHRAAMLAADSFACSIVLRYNASTPNALTIGYVGAPSCSSTHEAAIRAASSAVPKAAIVGGEPAWTPTYQCSTTVLWNPATASSPAIADAGAGCESSRGSALYYATFQVACMHRNTFCAP